MMKPFSSMLASPGAHRMAIAGLPDLDEAIVAAAVEGAARRRGQQRVDAAGVGLGDHRDDEAVVGAPSAWEWAQGKHTHW